MQDLFNIKWIELLDVALRALLSLVTLYLMTKMLGKKQVSQLSLFDYVIGISIGNFAAEMTINLDSHYLNGILAVVIFGVVAYLVSILTMKSIILRRFFMGVPTVLIQEGKLLEDNMKKVKYDINDLLEQCRSNGYFDLNEIEYGIMEANGKLSILPKAEYKPLTPKDMKLKVNKSVMVANIVIDGKIMKQNILNMNKTLEWVDKELNIKGYKELTKILLATLDGNDKIVIYERNVNFKTLNILE